MLVVQKLTKREIRVLEVVRDHGHMTALAIGTVLEPRGWDEQRRWNLGEAVAKALRAKGMMERSTPVDYWRVSTVGKARLATHEKGAAASAC